MNTSFQRKRLLPMLAAILTKCNDYGVLAALSQSDEGQYLSSFNSIQAASYAVADDDLPFELNVCKNSNNDSPPTREVTVQAASSVIDSSTVFNQCGDDSICIIPFGTTFQMNTNLNVGALIVRGSVEWNDDTQVQPSAFLCAGYVVVEGHGKWDMDLQQEKDAFIYIKDNGAVHDKLRSRAFGSYAYAEGDYPMIDINGRELVRTWSLLADPVRSGDEKMKLMHNAHLMGWRIGDRIGIAPTEERAKGYGEEFTIVGIDDKGSLLLDKPLQHDHAATFIPPPPHGNVPALMSAEVVNLSRNIVITGDDFKHVSCDPNLPESVAGEETSVLGCRCSSFRSQCTIGLHTAAMEGGSARIQNTRVERCGQRGIEGKYCLHFHKLHDCPTCLFKNNAIEGSHQRGIIVHGTHSSTVEENVLYNVRGAGIYIEDGNEMYNEVKYNAVICPFPFKDDTLHGCTVPGTSGRIADTSDNQSGIFTRAATNSLVGNRVSNSFNGMLLKAGSIGRGASYDKVCESAAKLARYEGNTFHGNGRFGTYTLGYNYAKATDQSILTDGHNVDKSLCTGFDSQGHDTGLSASIVDNLDYDNAFVGHYEAGEMQYHGHHSYDSNELIYWKETKNFKNGCSAHITGGSYARGNVALPDHATFLIENTSFGEGVSLEANHHCNVGTTGVLCFPTYMLHNVMWKTTDKSKKWVWFQWKNTQSHNANQNHGGIFTLSPPDAQHVMDGGVIDHSIFPPGFVSLVSSKFTHLLFLPGQPCVLSDSIASEFGFPYDNGILCKVPLRALKVYSRGQSAGSAPNLKVESWYNKGGVYNQVGAPDSSHIIPFHQTGRSTKQGYSLPVIPSADHSYRLSLTSGDGNIPSSWVVEFSDFIVGNRFEIEYINLSLNGKPCGQNGIVSSHHDRRFMWSGVDFMADEAWGNTGACAFGQPQDFPKIECSLINDGVIPAEECPEMCGSTCNTDSSYCDCGSATCKLKPGFTETLDLCGAARCGEHGSCSAQYLGGELPVTSNACICDEGWTGSLCQYNPCETLGKTCSGHGTCIGTISNDAKCDCDDGFSGDNCEQSCDGFCVGEFPYSCGKNIEGVVRYGCHKNGGCDYLREGDEYPFDGFCTYKQAQEQECLCGNDTECEMTSPCNSDGSCPSPQALPDLTSCNSIPFGVCQSGTCSSGGASVAPSKHPTSLPTNQSSSSPSSRPTTSVLSKSPTSKPTPSQTPYCGCSTCTEAVWNTPVTDFAGTYTCGQRISYLQTTEGGSKSEYDSCKQIGEDFPAEQCGPVCNPLLCNAPVSQLEDPDPSKLIWSDEFNVDGAPDPAKWDYDLGDGCDIGLCNWGNGEVAYYTKSPSNVAVSNGVLRIAAKKESGFSLPYTSARMVTRGLHSFKYGRIQFRASLANCKSIGTWPALWMLPEYNMYGGWPKSGEIDVMEAVGHEAEKIFGTVHTEANNGMIGTQKGSSISKSKDEWHTFEINWEEDRIQFAVDKQIYFEYLKEDSVEVWPFDQKFHLIMNLAVGGSWGGVQGIDVSSFQGAGQIMEVDWVRVYADTNNPQPTNQPTRTPPNQAAYCGCESCNQQVWDTIATDSSGSYSCGDRISWLQNTQGRSEGEACRHVASNFSGLCLCDPTSCTGTPVPTPPPTVPPSNNPTALPSTSPSNRPTKLPSTEPSKIPTSLPTNPQPTKQPTRAPSNQAAYCGCESCNQQVWDTIATGSSGSYSCGGRISWLQNTQGRSESEACRHVASEFPGLCLCDPTSCVGTPVPTPPPTVPPSNNPTALPSTSPSNRPTKLPSTEPSKIPTSLPTNPQPIKQPTRVPTNQAAYCGCESCNQQVWDTIVTDSSGSYSCGGRISWLQNTQGRSESEACRHVASEFPGLCLCDPTSCVGTPVPTPPPTVPPSNNPTALPSTPPTVKHCGCNSCTEEVWDRIATDGNGSFSCGARILWLQSAQSYGEAAACDKVAAEFPNTCLCGTVSMSSCRSADSANLFA